MAGSYDRESTSWVVVSAPYNAFIFGRAKPSAERRIVAEAAWEESRMDEFDVLPLEERVAACRGRAKELAVLSSRALSSEAAADLRDLARRWLALADRLEARDDQA
jgi:hypothetical protein